MSLNRKQPLMHMLVRSHDIWGKKSSQPFTVTLLIGGIEIGQHRPGRIGQQSCVIGKRRCGSGSGRDKLAFSRQTQPPSSSQGDGYQEYEKKPSHSRG